MSELDDVKMFLKNPRNEWNVRRAAGLLALLDTTFGADKVESPFNAIINVKGIEPDYSDYESWTNQEELKRKGDVAPIDILDWQSKLLEEVYKRNLEFKGVAFDIGNKRDCTLKEDSEGFKRILDAWLESAQTDPETRTPRTAKDQASIYIGRINWLDDHLAPFEQEDWAVEKELSTREIAERFTKQLQNESTKDPSRNVRPGCAWADAIADKLMALDLEDRDFNCLYLCISDSLSYEKRMEAAELYMELKRQELNPNNEVGKAERMYPVFSDVQRAFGGSKNVDFQEKAGLALCPIMRKTYSVSRNSGFDLSDEDLFGFLNSRALSENIFSIREALFSMRMAAVLLEQSKTIETSQKPAMAMESMESIDRIRTRNKNEMYDPIPNREKFITNTAGRMLKVGADALSAPENSTDVRQWSDYVCYVKDQNVSVAKLMSEGNWAALNSDTQSEEEPYYRAMGHVIIFENKPMEASEAKEVYAKLMDNIEQVGSSDDQLSLNLLALKVTLNLLALKGALMQKFGDKALALADLYLKNCAMWGDSAKEIESLEKIKPLIPILEEYDLQGACGWSKQFSRRWNQLHGTKARLGRVVMNRLPEPWAVSIRGVAAKIKRKKAPVVAEMR